MKWIRPELWNCVRELTTVTSKDSKKHMEAIKRTMAYCVQTPERGQTIKPNTLWDGTENFEFTIHEKANSNYTTDPENKMIGERMGSLFEWNLN